MTKLVFIGGSGRNGSTLLGRILGCLPGTVCIGEAPAFLLDPRRPRSKHPCSCGRMVNHCSFWSGLASTVTDADRHRVGRYLRFRYILHWLRRDTSAAFQRCRSALEHIYRYTLTTAKARSSIDPKRDAIPAEPVIIDTTKHPAYAAAASSLASVDFRFIHLIRDPRGVVESWARPKAYISAFSRHRTTLWWIAFHWGAERLARRVPTLTVRYEDFVKTPRATICSILNFIDEPSDGVATLFQGDRIMLGRDHLLGGNPDKFTAGAIRIRQPAATRMRHPFVSLTTFPWLLRYGYPFFKPDNP